MHRFVVFCVVSLVAVACAPDEQAGESPTPVSSPALAQSCGAPQQGYKVGYPQGWVVNDPEEADPCTWFHPESFELPQRTEATEIAIMLKLEDAAFGQLSEASGSGPDVAELVSEDETTVAGQQAVRVEKTTSGEGLYPEGTRVTIYTIDWDDGTLVASTTSVASGSYEENSDVLDQMMGTLQQIDVEASCSASAMSPDLEEQAELPDAATETRLDIAEAAIDCDFDRLAGLAEPDGEFTYSFGETGSPAQFWERQEADGQGPEPMKFLVGVLKRSFGTQEAEGETIYVWPSAFSYDSWAEIPDDDKEALKPLYDEVDFQRFEQFGGYAGYRAGIDADGNWLFFVAGD